MCRGQESLTKEAPFESRPGIGVEWTTAFQAGKETATAKALRRECAHTFRETGVADALLAPGRAVEMSSGGR